MMNQKDLIALVKRQGELEKRLTTDPSNQKLIDAWIRIKGWISAYQYGWKKVIVTYMGEEIGTFNGIKYERNEH
jgi:hypothetical protein